MEAFLTTEIFKSLTSGDYSKLLGYGLIFLFLWLEIRSLKQGIKGIRKDIVKSHGLIRREQKQVVVRIEKLEAHLPDDKGVYPRQAFNSPKGGVQL